LHDTAHYFSSQNKRNTLASNCLNRESAKTGIPRIYTIFPGTTAQRRIGPPTFPPSLSIGERSRIVHILAICGWIGP
jgi:hypothetical protein